MKINEDLFAELKAFIREQVGGWKNEKRFGLDKLNYNFHFYKEEDEIKLIQDLFIAINTYRPDFILAWNMAFDIPYIMAKGADGATTVAATMFIASLAGIKVFATGGIGGVHRGAETTMDISADLTELGRTPVAVVCAGAKSVLDIGLTLEYLETQGVPVVGFRTNKMPAFYTRDSGYNTPCRCDSVEELSDMVGAMANIPMRSGMVIVNPIPKEFEADEDMIDRATTKALREAEKNGITGRDVTPFLLARIAELTEGASLKANIALVYNNVRLAASVAAGVIQPD